MRLITAIAILFTAFAAYAAEPRIVRYDIYPNSAQVLFEVEVNNESQIMLPSAYAPKDIKLIRMANMADVEYFKAERVLSNSLPPEFLDDDKKAINALVSKIDDMFAKLSALELSAMFLDNANIDTVKSAELLSYIKTTSSMRENIAKDTIKIERNIAESKERLNALQKNYNSRLPKDSDTATSISIKIRKPGIVRFAASTTSVSWQPFYIMKLDSATGMIKAQISASIKQATGQRWQGDMVFHSDNPQKRYIKGNLPPLIIDIAQPAGTTARSAAPAMEMQDNYALKSQPKEYVGPAFSDNIIGTTIQTKASIDGDNISVNIPLKSFNIASSIVYELVPEISDYASISADIKSLPETLLQSSAELYIDDEYAMDTTINPQTKGNQATIIFGELKKIKAVKTPIIAKTDNGWVKGVYNNGYTIDITNSLNKNIILIVKDRIPVSANSKITVTQNEISPKPESITDGIIKWALPVNANGKTSIKVEYSIKYPNDANIIYR